MTERDFWSLTLPEFHALCERLLHREDQEEYCAALVATSIYNVYRSKHSPFLTPDTVMWRKKSRDLLAADITGKPVMRYAQPGERPPSSRPSGTNDTVIDAFDKMAARYRAAGATHHG